MSEPLGAQQVVPTFYVSTFQRSNVPAFLRHPYALQHFRCRAVPFARHFAIMPRYLSRRLYVATLRFSAGIFSSACVGARYIVPSFLFPAVAATFRSVLSLPFCGGRPSGRLFSPSASTVGASEVSPAREGFSDLSSVSTTCYLTLPELRA